MKTFAFFIMLLWAGVSGAVEPSDRLADPALEARARAVSQGLRCLVCQNESIDESNADLARDLRRLLRERIAAGDSDDAARQFMVTRYGHFVLLRPPVMASTWVLWFGAPIALLVALAGVWVVRRRPVAPPAPLTAQEQARLAALLDKSE